MSVAVSDSFGVLQDAKMPFLAQWRVDLSRPNDLVDSWDMLLQHKKGAEYIKPAWFGGPAEKVNDATRRRFTVPRLADLPQKQPSPLMPACFGGVGEFKLLGTHAAHKF